MNNNHIKNNNPKVEILLKYYHKSFLESKRFILFGVNLFFIIAFLQPHGLANDVNENKKTLQGSIFLSDGLPVIGAQIFIESLDRGTVTNNEGYFEFTNLGYGNYTLVISGVDLRNYKTRIYFRDNNSRIRIILPDSILTNSQSDEIVVTDSYNNIYGIRNLGDVEGTGIYAAKKSEVIDIDQLTANLATNNPRQVFAKVAGFHIWESDGAGIQLGVGGRGLSPNRTSNFNTRQNGYDISADALGYPESYYTPPVEALDQIEIIRGAASLQYGTQFGGMINFKFKRGNENVPIEVNSRQTGGSFGFFNSFNSIGGQVGDVNYYSFYQYKRGNGWRDFSDFEVHTAFASVAWDINENIRLSGEYTYMNYLAQQPGGMTDRQFQENPRQSLRERNWFNVDWQVAALKADIALSSQTKINTRTFVIGSSRQALGNLERINVVDFGEERTLITGDFNNIGNETRLLHTYTLFKNPANLLIGGRFYRGFTRQRQGDADATSEPNFQYLNPNDLENSDYDFPSNNIALFAEHIFRPTDKLSIVPGIRWENILTEADGFYRQRVFDFAGNIVADSITQEIRSRERSFALLGLGLSYQAHDRIEIYANASQNYRSITFNDLRIANPNFAIDPDIQDESGYTADIGARGGVSDFLFFDFSLFYLRYEDRIGLLLRSDVPPLFLPYRYRTNIADSRTYGLELFSQVNITNLFYREEPSYDLSFFTNISIIDARYINTDDPTIRNKYVELVPPFMLRAGLSFSIDKLSTSLQGSYTYEHYTDATNAIRTSTAVNGIIPSYMVWDFSVRYSFEYFAIDTGINNLLNEMYFTRRAEGYPGPGIIPSEGRSFYLTLDVKI